MNEENKEKIATFLQRVDALSKADRAVLKREAGINLTDTSGSALRVFYRLLPPSVPQWQESRFFAVGCLKCLFSPAPEKGQQLPVIISKLIYNKTLSGSAAHRAQVLLDLSWEEDGYLLSKLCRLVRLVYSKAPEITIDFERLLLDLLQWNSDSQYIQRNWARAIYQADAENIETEKGE